MPKTEVIFYQAADGKVPTLEWLHRIPPKALAKCVTKIERLQELGHELRRPEADFLRDKIYELRASCQGVHYRILYFFHCNKAAVLSHGIVKEKSFHQKKLKWPSNADWSSRQTQQNTPTPNE